MRSREVQKRSENGFIFYERPKLCQTYVHTHPMDNFLDNFGPQIDVRYPETDVHRTFGGCSCAVRVYIV